MKRTLFTVLLTILLTGCTNSKVVNRVLLVAAAIKAEGYCSTHTDEEIAENVQLMRIKYPKYQSICDE